MVIGTRLAALLEMRAVDADVFHAVPLGGAGRMFGGEAAARALAAAQRTVPCDRRVHVVQAVYLRAGDPTLPLHLRVARLRDGRTFSARRVDVEQDGRPILTATLSFQATPPFHVGGDAFAHQDPMPPVPPPGELTDLAGGPGGQAIWPDWAVGDPAFELRPVPGSDKCAAPAADGSRSSWYRLTGNLPADPALHECLWLYVSDLTLVASIRLPHEATDRKTWLMTSLNHTVWFHRPFRVDEWHVVTQRSPRAADGRGLAQGQVFTRDGALVSSIAQEGLAAPLFDGVQIVR